MLNSRGIRAQKMVHLRHSGSPRSSQVSYTSSNMSDDDSGEIILSANIRASMENNANLAKGKESYSSEMHNLSVRDAVSKLKNSNNDTIYLGTSENKEVVLQIKDKTPIDETPSSPSSQSESSEVLAKVNQERSSALRQVKGSTEVMKKTLVKPVSRRLSFSENSCSEDEFKATPKHAKKRESFKSPSTSLKKSKLFLKRKHDFAETKQTNKRQAIATNAVSVDEKPERRKSPRNSPRKLAEMNESATKNSKVPVVLKTDTQNNPYPGIKKIFKMK